MKKSWKTTVLLCAAVLIFGFSGCEADSVTPGNLVPTSYTVLIIQAANGTITASPIRAEQGATITLTASPASTAYQLKANSWSVKASDDTLISVSASKPYTFIMPASDVTVTAEFEAVPNDSGIVNVSLNAFYNGEISFDKDSVTLSQSEKTSVKISVEGVYESYSWIVDGKERSTAKTITLTAEDFNEQSNHNVSLVVYRDNIPYSASLVVTVTE
jgi:hypothetical protein